LNTRIIFGDEYRSLSSSLCSLLHFPVASSLLGPNILLSTLFSNTLSLCSSLSVRYHHNEQYLYYLLLLSLNAWLMKSLSLLDCLTLKMEALRFSEKR
jgi:hypothetical protein